MPKTLIAGTLYLITIDIGDYHSCEMPFRLYATRAKAERFIGRLKLHYSRKPVAPGAFATEQQTGEWRAKLAAWQVKHPGGSGYSGRKLDDWGIRPMSVC